MRMIPTILKNLVNKPATQPHPFIKRAIPAIYRGILTIEPEKCIMCKACATKCPTGCISVDPSSGLWKRDIMACVYCGVCVEVCPVKCIHMENAYTQPMSERQTQEYQCKPRVKKSAADKKDSKPEPRAENAAQTEQPVQATAEAAPESTADQAENAPVKEHENNEGNADPAS